MIIAQARQCSARRIPRPLPYPVDRRRPRPATVARRGYSALGICDELLRASNRRAFRRYPGLCIPGRIDATLQQVYKMLDGAVVKTSRATGICGRGYGVAYVDIKSTGTARPRLPRRRAVRRAAFRTRSSSRFSTLGTTYSATAKASSPARLFPNCRCRFGRLSLTSSGAACESPLPWCSFIVTRVRRTTPAPTRFRQFEFAVPIYFRPETIDDDRRRDRPERQGYRHRPRALHRPNWPGLATQVPRRLLRHRIHARP